jgi:tetratricopeptide (TPR) repeat protein
MMLVFVMLALAVPAESNKSAKLCSGLLEQAVGLQRDGNTDATLNMYEKALSVGKCSAKQKIHAFTNAIGVAKQLGRGDQANDLASRATRLILSKKRPTKVADLFNAGYIMSDLVPGKAVDYIAAAIRLYEKDPSAALPMSPGAMHSYAAKSAFKAGRLGTASEHLLLSDTPPRLTMDAYNQNKLLADVQVAMATPDSLAAGTKILTDLAGELAELEEQHGKGKMAQQLVAVLTALGRAAYFQDRGDEAVQQFRAALDLGAKPGGVLAPAAAAAVWAQYALAKKMMPHNNKRSAGLLLAELEAPTAKQLSAMAMGGIPTVIRGAMVSWQTAAWTPSAVAAANGDVVVEIAAIPYAKKYGVQGETTTLRAFVATHMGTSAEPTSNSACSSSSSTDQSSPLQLLQVKAAAALIAGDFSELEDLAKQLVASSASMGSAGQRALPAQTDTKLTLLKKQVVAAAIVDDFAEAERLAGELKESNPRPVSCADAASPPPAAVPLSQPMYIFHDSARSSRLFRDANLSQFESLPMKATSELYIGARGSGAHCHMHSAALNFLAHGTKRWYIFPPMQQNLGEDFYGMPVQEWEVSSLQSLPTHLAPYIFTQRAGEVLYIPTQWPHAVINLENVTGVTVQLDMGAFAHADFAHS